MFSLFTPSLFSIFLLGQDAARVVNMMNADYPGEETEEEGQDESTSLGPNILLIDLLTAHLRDAGHVYSFESEEAWILFLSRSFNSDVETEDPSEDGILLKWAATSPSLEILRQCSDLVRVDERELAGGLMPASSTELFLRAPPGRLLSQDTSLIRKGDFPIPPDEPTWQVVVIPWKSKEPNPVSALEHADLNELLRQARAGGAHSPSGSSSLGSSSSGSTSSSSPPLPDPPLPSDGEFQ